MVKKIQQKKNNYPQKPPLPKSYRRNLDLMKLLVSEPKFQEAVAEVRSKLKLPQGGFAESDKNILEPWREWLYEESDRISESEEFKSKIVAIHKKLDSKFISRVEANQLLKELFSILPLNILSHSGKELAMQFNIPKHFWKYIRQYIIYNKIDAPVHNFGGGIYQPDERASTSGYVPIEIYSQLNSDEFADLKKYIAWLTKERLLKHGKIPKIDEYLKVEDAWEDRLRTGIFEEPDYHLTAADIADDIFGDSSQDYKIRDMLRNLDEHRKNKLKPRTRGKK